MNSTVIYHSVLGHSKKIARAIAAELQVEADDIRENPQLKDIDLLCIVSGIYGGKSAPELLAFIRTLDPQQVRRVLLLTSSGGKTTPAAEVRAALTEIGINVLEEEFTCQGAILFVGMGRPNKTDLKNAVAFVQQTLQNIPIKDQ